MALRANISWLWDTIYRDKFYQTETMLIYTIQEVDYQEQQQCYAI